MCPELTLLFPLIIMFDGCLVLKILYNHDPMHSAARKYNHAGSSSCIHADTEKIAMPAFGRRDLMAPRAPHPATTAITIANELSPQPNRPHNSLWCGKMKSRT